MNKKLQIGVMFFVLAAVLAVAAFPMAPVAYAKGTVVASALKASASFPNATGKVKYTVDGAEREFEVEIQHIKSLAGKRLFVYVNGSLAGSFIVNSLGAGHMTRSTLKGQTVPFIVAGSKVMIRTGSGKLVASTQF
jgi:hypothetical protein